jgi:hypothetical protein
MIPSICLVSSAAEGRSAGGQRLAQATGQLRRLAVAGVVHVHHVGRHLVQMIVEGGHRQAPGEEPGHHGRDLLVTQHEVAHHHGLVAHGLEGGVGAEGEGRLDPHAAHGDREVRPWEADAEHAAALYLAALPEGLLDGLPVRRRDDLARGRP